MRQVVAGYAAVAIVLVAWPDKASWNNGSVIAIALGSLVFGWLAWIMIIERRFPRPRFRWGPQDRSIPGSLLVALIVFSIAFIAGEVARQAWPREYPIFEGPAPSTDDAERLTYTDAIELPVNVARQIIVYFAVAFAGSVVGTALLQAIHGWRTRRREEWS